MRLSVVIPARDEAPVIGQTIDRVLQGNPWEVIVADGWSTDATRRIAELHGAGVIVAAPGRANQMNAGASVATGDALLFLHADTLLPPRFDRRVDRLLRRSEIVAGAFRLRIGGSQASLRLVERAVNWRSRALQLPYGDQALFLRRETFDELGGYAPLPVMEDFEFVRRLRRLGRIALARASVLTSGRRWLRQGVVRTTLLNQLCIAAFMLGVPPDRIARWRGAPEPEAADAHAGSASSRIALIEPLQRASSGSRPKA